MAYRKRTLRKLPPTTRQLAHLADSIGSVERILKNLIPKIERLERDSQALANHTCQPCSTGKPVRWELAEKVTLTSEKGGF